MDTGTVYGIGFSLVLTGTIIIILSIILTLISSMKHRGKVRGGGAIIIGPVPIIFGTDKKSLKTILLLSIILTALLAIITVLFHLMSE
jgi:uncharacterized protein (TIGR00304 family)